MCSDSLTTDVVADVFWFTDYWCSSWYTLIWPGWSPFLCMTCKFAYFLVGIREPDVRALVLYRAPLSTQGSRNVEGLRADSDRISEPTNRTIPHHAILPSEGTLLRHKLGTFVKLQAYRFRFEEVFSTSGQHRPWAAYVEDMEHFTAYTEGKFN
jgi:hypothetical protein